MINDKMWDLAGEAETLGEDIIALEEHLVVLDKERQDTRVTARSMKKKPKGSSWVLTDVGLFLRKSNEEVAEGLHKNQERLEDVISESRGEMKEKMRRLAELENNEDMQKWAAAFNLRPLGKNEANFNPNHE